MSESEIDIDRPHTGHAGRILAVLAALLVVAAMLWWLWWADRGLGEPEQAHRVLVVGGTPTDLTTPIAEAGFEARQLTWTDAEAEVRALEGSFDAQALLDHADARGHGFVALMLGDDFPLGVELFGASIPADAVAAVVAVGSLRLDGEARVAFGSPPVELDYGPGLRRIDGLRMALYEHPDLVRLWDDPSPEQMQQQIQLGDLADARTLLAATLERYADALAAWPDRRDLPDESLAPAWTRVRGFPMPEGVALERRQLRLRVDARRQITIAAGPRDVVYVADAELDAGDPFARAPTLALPEIEGGALSPDRRWLVATQVETGELHRWALAPGRVEDRGVVDLPPEDVLFVGSPIVASTGEAARLEDWGIDSELGPLEPFSAVLHAVAWHAPGVVAIGLRAYDPGTHAAPIELVVFARPRGEPPDEREAPPTPDLLALAISELASGSAPAPGEGQSQIVALLPSATASFAVVRHTPSDGNRVDELIRLALPAAALRATERAPPTSLDDRPSSINGAALRPTIVALADVRELDGVAIDSLGLLPPAEQLELAPDGRAIAWRAPGSNKAIYVATIADGVLGMPQRVAETPASEPAWDDGPLFSADGSYLLVTGTHPWAFGTIELVRAISTSN